MLSSFVFCICLYIFQSDEAHATPYEALIGLKG